MAKKMIRICLHQFATVALALAACRAQGRDPDPRGSGSASDSATDASVDARPTNAVTWLSNDGGAADGGNAAQLALQSASFMQSTPELRAAYALFLDQKPAEAAVLVRAYNDGHKATACEGRYTEARLYQVGNQLPEALASFQRYEAPELGACSLSAHAFAHAAELASRLGRGDVAMRLAERVPEGHIAYADALLIGADARTQDVPGAIARYRTWLKSYAKVGRVHDVEWKLAKVLARDETYLKGPGGAEVLSLMRTVLVEAPRIADNDPNIALYTQTHRTVNGKDPAPFTLAEHARRAQAYADASDKARVAEETDAPLKSSKPGDSGVALCRMAMARAQVTAKSPKSAVADAWGEAIARCDGQDDQVTALYTGAKASVSAARPDEALSRFATVEARFPRHRFADDARYRSAMLLASAGDDKRSRAALEALVHDYPEGDMRPDAYFQLASPLLLRGAYAEALPVLDSGLAAVAADMGYTTAGRLAYFRARVAEELGQLPDAKLRYASIVRDFPLFYYGILAELRLSKLDPNAVTLAIAEGKARDAALVRPEGTAHASNPRLTMAALLMRTHDIEYARREIDTAALSETEQGPFALWDISNAYSRAGAFTLAVAPFRGKLTSHLGHYPVGVFRTAWEAACPRAYEEYVQTACTKAALPNGLAWGIMREESSFDANAQSPTHALGLMQLMGDTAKWVAKGTDIATTDNELRKPSVSIALGTKLLAKLLASEGHLALAIAAYNAGSGSVRNWKRDRGTLPLDLFVETIPYEETRNYVKRVLSTMAVYAALGDAQSIERLRSMPLTLASAMPAPQSDPVP